MCINRNKETNISEEYRTGTDAKKCNNFTKYNNSSDQESTKKKKEKKEMSTTYPKKEKTFESLSVHLPVHQVSLVISAFFILRGPFASFSKSSPFLLLVIE